MSLDDKLGPISRRLGPVGRAYHRIDDEVHRYYEKIVKRWEDDGHERQTLVTTNALIGNITCVTVASLNVGYGLASMIPASFAAGLHSGFTHAHCTSGGTPDGTRLDGDKKIIYNPFRHKAWQFLRGPRLTFLVGGCGAFIAGGTHIVQGINDTDLNTVMTGVTACVAGIYGISHASAIDFVDKEPSLLDKAPAWKQALHSVKEYLAPTPAPVPTPVQNYLATDVNQ